VSRAVAKSVLPDKCTICGSLAIYGYTMYKPVGTKSYACRKHFEKWLLDCHGWSHLWAPPTVIGGDVVDLRGIIFDE